ncbi:MAG: TolC family protein [Bryobacterales bacterium]
MPIPGREGAVLSSINTTLGPSLNVAWEPDVWGKVKSAKLASTAEVQASQADLVGARLSLTGQVAKAWFSAIEANRQLQLAKAALESYQYSSDRVRARFEAGVRPSLDLRLTLTQVRNAQSRLEQRRQLLDASVRQLETLLGQYPAAEYALAEDLPECPVGVPAGLPSELVHRRPDLIAAERRLLASDARIAQSKAALRPRFNLTSALGTSTNQLQDVLNGNVLIWNLVSGVTTPIFNNGRLKAAVRQDELVRLKPLRPTRIRCCWPIAKSKLRSLPTPISAIRRSLSTKPSSKRSPRSSLPRNVTAPVWRTSSPCSIRSAPRSTPRAPCSPFAGRASTIASTCTWRSAEGSR